MFDLWSNIFENVHFDNVEYLANLIKQSAVRSLYEIENKHHLPCLVVSRVKCSNPFQVQVILWRCNMLRGITRECPFLRMVLVDYLLVL
jgi:hypothetical protein